MKILANKEIKRFIGAVAAVLVVFSGLSALFVWIRYGELPVPLLILSLLLAISVLAICFLYFVRQHRTLADAVAQIQAYLGGDVDTRIDCDRDGELYRLFHEINTLAAVLNAHAANERRDKEFLKNTISDISHQLKTPLAALSIYNGLLQNEAEELREVKEFAALSEQELDRMETLVQNLLKITRLDAGAIRFEKTEQNVAEMMRDVELQFAYRAKREQKKLVLSGGDQVVLACDRDWLMEAVGNLVKNALDHTKAGDAVRIEWRRFASVVQIKIKDTGCGVHPEDLPHIFKRFYRSRFSKDIQGLGLGLPLAKAIIEAHGGTIEADSELGAGTTFVINFLIPTKL